MRKATRSELISFLLLALYGALLVYLSSRHEMWRDEVRALSIAQTSANLPELFSLLQNEGHPSLWYLALYGGSSLWHSPQVMPLLSVLIALLAALIFLRSAPFPLFIKALWLFGFYPLYEYAVVCRSYGLGMLFIFLFLSFFPSREKNPWSLAISLACIANTSAFAWIVSAALSLSLVFEFFLAKHFRVTRLSPKLILISAFVMAAHMLAAFQMWPDSKTVVSGVHTLDVPHVVLALRQALVHQGATFHNGFSLPFPWAVPLILIATYALMIRTPANIIFLLALAVGMELFNALIYSGLALRHQGMLVLGVLSAYWLDEIRRAEIFVETSWFTKFEPLRKQLKLVALAAICALQVYAAAKAVKTDILYPMSSAEELSRFVAARAELQSAIIIAEPDFVAETLPYYLKNKIYFPREGEFKRFVSFSAASRSDFSLSELITSAERISQVQKTNVLLLLPTDIEEEKAHDFLYGRSFVVDEAGITELRNKAEMLTKLDNAQQDENYSVWLLRAPGG